MASSQPSITLPISRKRSHDSTITPSAHSPPRRLRSPRKRARRSNEANNDNGNDSDSDSDGDGDSNSSHPSSRSISEASALRSTPERSPRADLTSFSSADGEAPSSDLEDSDSSISSDSNDDSDDSGPLQEEEDEEADDDDDIITISTAKKPVIKPIHETGELRAKLAAFLPQMAEANEVIERLRRAGDALGVGFEDPAEEDEGGYIEMNLGLGVLEEKDPDAGSGGEESGSWSSEEEVEGKELSASCGRAGFVGVKEVDVLGRLLGQRRNAARTQIQEIGGE
ncbi:hypothetical protein LTR50_003486 [Elasticomyces elasticus]|nr:hypothetical protein LTR50_003486 [Elasticomyces elasticus]